MSDNPKRTYTNVLGLPEPIVRAVVNDDYDPQADFSATGLIKPPRVLALERQHAADIVEDVADRLWALIGQVGHTILERAGNQCGITERRLFIKRELNGALYTISGKMDLWDDTVILDYKFTSRWTTRDGLKPEWEQQLNLYMLLARENGLPATEARIIAIYRDWSVGEARKSKDDYPQRQVEQFKVPIWSRKRQEEFLMQRMFMHLAARTTLPDCTDEERWARPEKWAVIKQGNQNASKLFEDKNEAVLEAQNRGPAYDVERRPGVQTRCLDYCAAAPWCKQFEMLDPANYQAMLAAKRPTLV
jgi:hypothetical protein